MIQRKSAIDASIDSLATGLSEAGAPNGQKPVNGNRVMIDVAPASRRRGGPGYPSCVRKRSG